MVFDWYVLLIKSLESSIVFLISPNSMLNIESLSLSYPSSYLLLPGLFSSLFDWFAAPWTVSLSISTFLLNQLPFTKTPFALTISMFLIITRLNLNLSCLLKPSFSLKSILVKASFLYKSRMRSNSLGLLITEFVSLFFLRSRTRKYVSYFKASRIVVIKFMPSLLLVSINSLSPIASFGSYVFFTDDFNRLSSFLNLISSRFYVCLEMIRPRRSPCASLMLL